jgi:hypothetical protein
MGYDWRAFKMPILSGKKGGLPRKIKRIKLSAGRMNSVIPCSLLREITLLNV